MSLNKCVETLASLEDLITMSNLSAVQKQIVTGKLISVIETLEEIIKAGVRFEDMESV